MISTTARILMALLRATIPLVVLAGGIGSLLYGVGRHSASVSVEQEIEIDLAPPPGVEPPGLGQPGPGFGDPALDGQAEWGLPPAPVQPPWLSPPRELSKMKQKIVLAEETSELALIREVTFGGVTRLSSGVLWRTYTGAPPSLCPT
jgi:hypothetical protein